MFLVLICIFERVIYTFFERMPLNDFPANYQTASDYMTSAFYLQAQEPEKSELNPEQWHGFGLI